ncbi:MAG TPA: glycosyltransferase [Chthoniobacter sp.]|nr:glycosyltransferase [Chthoniobacter sp.]
MKSEQKSLLVKLRALPEEMALGDMIFISLESWDEIWRRNQFLCAELVRRNPQAKILFVAPARDVSNALRRRELGSLRAPSLEEVPGFDGRVVVTRAWKLLPNSLSLGRRMNEAMLRSHVRRMAGRLGMRAPLLWINAHEAGHMAGRMGESAVIYDVTDDWTEFERGTPDADRARQQDAELCSKADVVIVCSERLQEIKKPLCAKVELVANGVDADHYQCVLDDTGPLPPEATRWARPVFGYTGTVHSERVDVDLLEALAGRLECGSIVLVGPNHLSPDQVARLEARGNVHLCGPVPYARVPQIMRAFDVCIVPHRMTAFTESLNPIKLWEYLAAGKPIVSTNVAGFRDYSEVVSIASTAGEFFRAMQAALSEARERGQQRRDLVREHSWEARAIAVETVIREALVAEKSGPNSHGEIAADRPTISAILVNYNTRDMTLECLRSLWSEVGDIPAEVIVVDNASTDGSAEAIAQEFPDVKLIRNERNAGFAAGNNLAFRVARGRFFLIINTDAFLKPGALSHLLDFCERNPKVGFAGPRLLNRDGSLQHSCFRFPSPLQCWLENLWVPLFFRDHPVLGDYYRWDYASEREVDFVSGACILARREVYEEVGGLDERFFMYQEETDWQRRAWSAGWRVCFTPDAEVVHYGGESGRGNSQRINQHFFESLDRYELKHHGFAGFLLMRMAMLLGCSIRAALWALVAFSPGRRLRAIHKARFYRSLLVRQLITGMPPGSPS